MAFECLLPFLEVASFQNLHHAGLRDIDLGVNKDMLLLGTGFGLEPCDLLKIVHDKNNKLTRHKVMELLNTGVTNIDYISNFDRLCDLGFTITEILILLHGSISIQNIFVYDLVQLYNALGFTSKCKIQFLMRKNVRVEQILPFIQTGLDLRYIPDYIKLEISPIQVLPFHAIGFKSALRIKKCLRAHVSPEQVSPFIQTGLDLRYIPDYIRLEISPIQVLPFHAIGFKSALSIKKCLRAHVSPEQVSPFIQNRRFSRTDDIISYIKYEISPIQALPFHVIGFKSAFGISNCLDAHISPEQVSPYLRAEINQFTLSKFIVFYVKNSVDPCTIRPRSGRIRPPRRGRAALRRMCGGRDAF